MYRKNCACFISILIGIIFGIIVGYNAFITLIPGITNALWIGILIGIISLVLLTITSIFAGGRKEICLCTNGKCLAIAALGTIIASIIGLSITIVVESTLIALLLGMGTVFLTTTIFSTIQLIFCLIDSNCRCRE